MRAPGSPLLNLSEAPGTGCERREDDEGFEVMMRKLRLCPKYCVQENFCDARTTLKGQKATTLTNPHS